MLSSATDVERWRGEFFVTARYSYLDHATVGPLPRRTVEAVRASAERQGREGSLVHPALHQGAEDLRSEFARFLNTNPIQLAIQPSTSAAVSTVASGIDWRDGDNVVVPAIDFPSVVFPWMVFERKGVTVRRVPCPGGRVEESELLAACDARTRVVAVSWVQFSSGWRINLAQLGEECRRRGIMVVVDVMQGVGALRLDLSSLPVDAVASQSYKWLLGPQCVGWLWLANGLWDRLEMNAAGARSVGPRASFLDHSFQPISGAPRFEGGILNFHGIAGAAASLAMLKKAGAETVEKRVLDLSKRLASGLRALGCELLGDPLDDRRNSGIVVFKYPRCDASECHRAFSAAGIVTSVRESAVRVSPHYYNTEGEIDGLLAVLSGHSTGLSEAATPVTPLPSKVGQ